MKKIFAIAWKDAIIRFASSSELLFFIILPIVFTFLLAGGTPSGNEDPRIGLLVVDDANTPISRQILAELENSTAVRPEVLTHADAQKQFDDRRADAVFIIPAGMDIAALQSGSAEVELLQQPNNINATVAERAVQTAIRRVSSAVSAAQNAIACGILITGPDSAFEPGRFCDAYLSYRASRRSGIVALDRCIGMDGPTNSSK